MRALSLNLLALSALGGCMRDAPSPDPGRCALAPPGEEVYTWGEIRIGTCLSGPADMRFFEKDGRTFLGVTNANPYLDYATGSLLVIDWESIDFTRDRNWMHEVRAGAIPIDDYLGGFGVMNSREQILVTGRKSEGRSGRAADDRVYLIDIENPLNPTSHRAQPRISMRDDPFPVVIDEDAGRAYVGQLTDHSVAVFDITKDELERIDVAPRTVIEIDALLDADSSGSIAEISAVDVVLAEQLVDDRWTLDWVDGSVRVWIPEPAEEGFGLQRYTDVGLGPVPSALGIEVDPESLGPFRDASFASLTAPFIYFVDERGNIARVGNDGSDGLGVIGNWDAGTFDEEMVPGTWDAILGGPHVAVVDDLAWLFYDGRTEETAPAIGATPATGAPLFTNPIAPILDPVDFDGFAGFEDPMAWHDVSHDAVMLWLTATLDDGRRVVALSTSPDDGVSWTAPEIVLEDVAADLSHPAVVRMHGRFEMWFTHDDGAAWTHRQAWSWDGRNWFEEGVYLDSPLPYDPTAEPPRATAQGAPTAGWRVDGRDSGPLDLLVSSGVTFIDQDHGYSLRVSSGQEVYNSIVPDGRAEVGLTPGSLIDLGGVPSLYVTLEDDARTRLGLLQLLGGSWVSVASDLIPQNAGGNKAGVRDPVVVAHDDGFTMFYAATNAQQITTIRRATSSDGVSWTAGGGAALTNDDDWDGVEQYPHSVEVFEDGSIRLWYAGGNGSRLRIGAAVASGPNANLRAETGEFDPWRFEPGVPGSFDDGGVRDPVVFTDSSGETHLIYAGFDGQLWGLGHAVLQPDGSFTRRTDPVSDATLPSMTGEPLSFSALGALSPVLVQESDGDVELLFAGTDGVNLRMGRAVGTVVRQWPAMRRPTVGDQLAFTTEQGRSGLSVIELAQSVETFTTTGFGMSGMTHDPDRGMLYIPSKLNRHLYVVDIRDDSGGSFDDANALDLEGLVEIDNLGQSGFRDVMVDHVRDRLYMTSRNPDGLVIVDLTRLVDDDTKDVTWHSASAVLPLQDLNNDAGETTVAQIGGAGMAMTQDNRYLLVAHHRGNGLAMFDLDRGAWGSEISWLADIGENPHLVRMSPDGRHAVVANYVGQILEDQSSSSTLAVIDVDPASATFGEVVTWLANR